MHFALFLMQENSPDPQQIAKIMMTVLPLIMIVILVGIFIVILPFWFICKKAGFSPWLALLNLIPLGNLILLYVLAFADWKVAPIPAAQLGYPFPPPPPPQA
jgi:hypothetical protein